MTIDERISTELRRHVPQVDEHAAWERIRSTAPTPSSRRALRLVPISAAALVLVVVGLVLINGFNSDPDPASPPLNSFDGTWVAQDDDGSTPTATFDVSSDGVAEIVVVDDLASVCAGAPSTMTGNGRIEGDTVLVIPVPVYTCDDGTTPRELSGTPLDEQLRNLTFTYDAEHDTLTDTLGLVWAREGAEKPTASGQMWPQSSSEELREAQERADAGDPDYTWQVGTQLTLDDPWAHIDEFALIDRFLREELGWDAYMYNPRESGDGDGWADGLLTNQRYLRCAPGHTNPLYPGETCAPTLDDLRYESVSLDLAQPAHQGLNGIWVVNRWSATAPFAQVDPGAVEAQVMQRVEQFLDARLSGQGADGQVKVYASPGSLGVDKGLEVPLLYATTSGAPYERYEIDLLDGPYWPDAFMRFVVRLFADGGGTVVEQEISWEPCCGGLWLYVGAVTENGQPVTASYTSSDGEVSVSAPSTWSTWSGGGANHSLAPGVWFWELYRDELGDEDRIEFADPVAYDAWCTEHGGSPLLSEPASAAEIAEKLIADPNFDTTPPESARVGGLDALSIDVAMAPGGKACGIGMIEISRWIHAIEWDPGLRLRLYLVDLPEGMSVATLAITVVAPEDRFDEVIAETAPIIESIEFHAP